MKISKDAEYLVLYSTEDDTGGMIDKVFFESAYDNVLNTWTRSTRVSPIYRLHLPNSDENQMHSFTNNRYHLIFIGPLSPHELDIHIFSETQLWISYGFFNVVCKVEEEKISKILAFLNERNVHFEDWALNGNLLIERKLGIIDISVENLDISLIKQYEETDVLFSSLREFFTLSKACYERIKYVRADLAQELGVIVQFVSKFIKTSDDEITRLSKFGFITTLNACLSRFTSQSLSGTSPLHKTESHLWGHSFLGIGITNLALHNLAQFISERIGAKEFPYLLQNFITDENIKILDLTSLERDDAFWFDDHLAKITVNKEEAVPVISYFSGRDGFRSQHNTLSVPLESLYSCNTSGASLKTITHEISHIIIRGCLPKIIPSINNSYAKKFFDLVKNRGINSFKDAVQSYLLKAFIKTSMVEIDSDYDAKVLLDIVRDKYREVDEIITSTFDYMYFYKRNTKSYLSALWSTWSEIPNIQDRIEEYSIRSICALMSNHLKLVDCHTRAKEEFLEIMNNLIRLEKKSPQKIKNMKDAVDCVKNSWDKKGVNLKKLNLCERILKRKDLVRFTRTFLFSEKIVSTIYSDEWLSYKNFKLIAKDIQNLNLVEQPIGNILNFIDEVSKSKNKSIAESLIIYYALAFKYERKQ